MNKRCGNCGSKYVEPKDMRGPFVWKDFPATFLKNPIEVLHCEDCGESILSSADGAKIDKLIEGSITEDVQEFIRLILEREKTLQTVLSVRLGVTPEYLSEIKSGRKLPSFQTFNFLKILALDKRAFALSDPRYVRAG